LMIAPTSIMSIKWSLNGNWSITVDDDWCIIHNHHQLYLMMIDPSSIIIL
jgi:plasmid maintenance system killer protein